MAKLLFVLSVFLVLINGHVVPERRAATPVLCTTVNKLITAAKQQSLATAFCSSYIPVPVATVTKTASIQTITAATTQLTTITLYVETKALISLIYS